VVEEWLVDEMPVGLVAPAFSLDIISESGALDKSVVLFVSSKVAQRLESVFSPLHDILVAVLVEMIVGDSGSFTQR